MKTIEERADEFIGHPYECDEGTTVSMARTAYTQGATEQKAIDIDRACQLHCSCCMAYMPCSHRGKFYCGELEKIRKAMEE